MGADARPSSVGQAAHASPPVAPASAAIASQREAGPLDVTINRASLRAMSTRASAPSVAVTPAPIASTPASSPAAPYTPTLRPGFARQHQTDGFAIAALVLGICGFSVFAIVFGVLSLARTGPGRKKGRGMAVAGLVLGILWIVAVIILYAAIAAAAS
jgi:hypothetical protein